MGLFDSVVNGLAGGADGLAGGLGTFAGEAGAAALGYGMSSRLLEKAQDYNTRVMSHKHQWEVSDLEKAGLNPVLSALGSTGTLGSPAASSPDVDNPVVSSALVAKTDAEKENIRQSTRESKARESLYNAEASGASAKAVVSGVEAKQKVREFEAVDQGTFSRDIVPYIESLPSYLRGPMRLGTSSAGKLYDDLKYLYNRFVGGKSKKDVDSKRKSVKSPARHPLYGRGDLRPMSP